MGISIRKNGTVTAQFTTPQEIVISHANDSIQLGDGTNLVGVSSVGGSYALKVDVVATVGSAGGGGTSSTDKATYTAGTTGYTPAGGYFDDVATSVLSEGEGGACRMTAYRGLHVNLRDSAGAELTTLPVSDGGGSLTVDGTFWQATQPVSIAATVAVSGPLTDAQLRASAVPVSGTFWQATQPVSIAAAVPVTDNGGSLTVDGTVAISGSVAVTGTFWQATQPVSIAAAVSTTPAGNVAHDAVDSGNPLKVGFVARQANPTAVAGGDRVDGFADDVGRQVVVVNQARDLVAMQQTTITSSVAETTIVTGTAGVFNDLVALYITNSSATALIVTLKDATAGTTRGIFAIAANGGIAIQPTTPFPQAAVNSNWTLTCGTSVASVYVTALYAKNV